MKKLFLLFITIIFTIVTFAQKLDSTALIIIDIQDFYFPGGAVELDEPVKASEKAKILLNHFRKNNNLVVHVRHNFEPGGNIHELVKPIEGEKIISKDEVNAFLNTDLNEYLKKNNIKEVILCGMQTQMCLKAGTRAAHDFGYKWTVVEDACTTRNISFGEHIISSKDVHYSTLATLKSYAKIVTLIDFLQEE
ncbi:MAG: cysteine hydrolase [Prolixibacteraceae bacterium]|jgi:nicotinamidase-related amidase|nr:cysteine hydrolase [Prolixibacteraceae bacterium]MBT6998910.1 cysteine hydrolase [Prolixibacteraceae bacterium]MBT7395172.1 cysteine hydrolase [Prolixibacteraceae bacterium]